ncbi:SOS response-associated peptidase family protein [Pseudomonas sp. BCRC 81390]|uniref:SOS response-associated peptidase n=1 Tax=Pseudomonas sp. BCRC 81390 TaxID=3054778 RepID=UPI002592DA3C|nr:SOS response-associated peptidase family protein [Pseudomonas sp. BCRC 81390]MDM3888840.1 SOS response-associated peptidase family protein [Pseudomonas sp. BCRC 81390]
MCGRLSQYRGVHDFVATLSLPEAWRNNIGDQPLGQYNIAPTTPVAVLRMDAAGLRADLVKWGWRPHWATDRAAPINARVEKVAHGPFFRAIWPYRAITPVDGWYEWVDEGGPRKQPYFIRRRDGRPALCASIGQFIGNAGDGCVIITADAQGGLVDVHDRRPVVLSPQLARAWIAAGLPSAQAEQLVLNLGEPADCFEWFRVSAAVGNVRNQGAELIDPLP